MLDLRVLQNRIVQMTKARIEALGEPEPDEDLEAIDDFVGETISELANDVMPELDATQWFAVYRVNPEWLHQQMGIGDGTLADAMKMTVRRVLCERCDDAMDDYVAEYKATHPAARRVKGMSK